MFKTSIVVDPELLRQKIKDIVETEYGSCVWLFYEAIGISRSTITKCCTRWIMGKHVQDALFGTKLLKKEDILPKKQEDVENSLAF